ncbi:MAG: sel1 repeat family protein [Selenomonadaceae bacterium]|nr:sel1 repeat family protein [Selenomonadaceae bacterium]
MYQNESDEGKQNYEKAHAADRRGEKAKSFKYYLKAAEAGIVPAMVACGNFFLEGEYTKQDISKAMYWFTKAAENGNLVATNNIGYIYETDENYTEAFNWYKKAAEMGDIVAMMNLAGFYEEGLGTRKSKKFAKQWRDKAESSTDLKSVKNLAGYYQDTGVALKAVEFYQKAIQMGDTESFGDLGDLYFDIEDYEDAEKCYIDGAKVGDINSMLGLGIMLTYAPGCFDDAKIWLSRAADGGSTYALRMMGDLYFEYKKYPQALRWYRKAVIAGEIGAREEIPKVKKILQNSKPNYKLKLRRPS